MSELRELMTALRGSVPHELLSVRSLPGGGQWVFIPWRNLVKLLDLHTGGEWDNRFSDARYLEPGGEYLKADQKAVCEIHCTITICGFSREGVGTAAIQQVSKSGNDGTQGDPIERARANAFRAACEMWGIGVYLHRQKADKKWQAELIKRVHAAKKEADQNWIAA